MKIFSIGGKTNHFNLLFLVIEEIFFFNPMNFLNCSSSISEYDCNIHEDITESMMFKTEIFFNIIILDMYRNIIKYLISSSEYDLKDYDLEDLSEWEEYKPKETIFQKILSFLWSNKKEEEDLTPKKTDTMCDRVERVYKHG